ncbi:MAG: hypothetical protein KBC16_03275 [Candidatus Pacebacteria bacterium]|nr:hypothetical protein [Candidatus Paceibacterota bacterium]
MKKMALYLLIAGGVLVAGIVLLVVVGVGQTIYTSVYGVTPGTDDKAENTLGACGLPRLALLNVTSLFPYDKHRARIGTGGEYTDSPLLAAMNSYHKADFKRLLENGTNPNDAFAGTSKFSILFLSAKHCDSWFTKELLAHGADPDGRIYMSDGQKKDRLAEEGFVFTPLYSAILVSSLHQIRALVEGGADVNLIGSLDSPDEVSLKDAVFTDQYGIAVYLIEHGASPVLNQKLISTLRWDLEDKKGRYSSEEFTKYVQLLKEKHPNEYGDIEI